MQPPDDVVAGIRAGRRRDLARGITLAESTRPDHRDRALAILDELLPDTGAGGRVGISGAPGVGKSTLIESLGLHLVDLGHRVAVLAVDPSSTRTGGSILGDKTRMPELAKQGSVFIRPSPSGGTLGGVARRSRETILLCEAFGFDVVLVETVGVGQSETAVDDLVDTFVLLVQPAAGDELQGIKRGVMELADLIVVTKSDGELAAAARRSAAEYTQALRLLRAKHPGWEPPVLAVSALTGQDVAQVWTAIRQHREALLTGGAFHVRRMEQAKSWLWSEIRERVLERFLQQPAVARRLPGLEDAVGRGRMTPSAAARDLLAVQAAVPKAARG